MGRQKTRISLIYGDEERQVSWFGDTAASDIEKVVRASFDLGKDGRIYVQQDGQRRRPLAADLPEGQYRLICYGDAGSAFNGAVPERESRMSGGGNGKATPQRALSPSPRRGERAASPVPNSIMSPEVAQEFQRYVETYEVSEQEVLALAKDVNAFDEKCKELKDRQTEAANARSFSEATSIGMVLTQLKRDVQAAKLSLVDEQYAADRLALHQSRSHRLEEMGTEWRQKYLKLEQEIATEVDTLETDFENRRAELYGRMKQDIDAFKPSSNLRMAEHRMKQLVHENNFVEVKREEVQFNKDLKAERSEHKERVRERYRVLYLNLDHKIRDDRRFLEQRIQKLRESHDFAKRRSYEEFEQQFQNKLNALESKYRILRQRAQSYAPEKYITHGKRPKPASSPRPNGSQHSSTNGSERGRPGRPKSSGDRSASGPAAGSGSSKATSKATSRASSMNSKQATKTKPGMNGSAKTNSTTGGNIPREDGRARSGTVAQKLQEKYKRGFISGDGRGSMLQLYGGEGAEGGPEKSRKESGSTRPPSGSVDSQSDAPAIPMGGLARGYLVAESKPAPPAAESASNKDVDITRDSVAIHENSSTSNTKADTGEFDFGSSFGNGASFGNTTFADNEDDNHKRDPSADAVSAVSAPSAANLSRDSNVLAPNNSTSADWDNLDLELSKGEDDLDHFDTSDFSFGAQNDESKARNSNASDLAPQAYTTDSNYGAQTAENPPSHVDNDQGPEHPENLTEPPAEAYIAVSDEQRNSVVSQDGQRNSVVSQKSEKSVKSASTVEDRRRSGAIADQWEVDAAKEAVASVMESASGSDKPMVNSPKQGHGVQTNTDLPPKSSFSPDDDPQEATAEPAPQAAVAQPKAVDEQVSAELAEARRLQAEAEARLAKLQAEAALAQARADAEASARAEAEAQARAQQEQLELQQQQMRRQEEEHRQAQEAAARHQETEDSPSRNKSGSLHSMVSAHGRSNSVVSFKFGAETIPSHPPYAGGAEKAKHHQDEWVAPRSNSDKESVKAAAAADNASSSSQSPKSTDRNSGSYRRPSAVNDPPRQTMDVIRTVEYDLGVTSRMMPGLGQKKDDLSSTLPESEFREKTGRAHIRQDSATIPDFFGDQIDNRLAQTPRTQASAMNFTPRSEVSASGMFDHGGGQQMTYEDYSGSGVQGSSGEVVDREMSRQHRAELTRQKNQGRVEVLKEGAVLVKYPMGRGKPDKRWVVLSADGQVIHWGDAKKKRVRSSASLKEASLMVYGPQTNPFMRRATKITEPWLCFSIIFKKRTLDFCCLDEKQLSDWYLGIQSIISDRSQFSEAVISEGELLWKRFRLRVDNFAARKKTNRQALVAEALFRAAKGETGPSPTMLARDSVAETKKRSSVASRLSLNLG